MKRERLPLKWARIKNQALVLEKTGEGEVHDIDGPRLLIESGAYFPEAGRRYYLRESVGPGYVTVFAGGNPEPLGGGEVKGYGSAFLAQFLGPLMALALDAWKGPSEGFQVKPWMRWALLAVAALVLVGVFVWQFTRGGHG